MKRVGMVIAGLLPLVAFGDLTQARNQMSQAMSDLGNQGAMGLVMTGTETRGFDVVQLQSEMAVRRFVESDGQVRTYFELRSFRDGALSQRMVADGLRLYVYNPSSNTYFSITYDLKNGNPRDGDTAALKMLRSARRYTSGPENMMMQMLIEAQQARNIYTNPLINTWHPWMPNSQIQMMGDGFRTWTSVPRQTYLEYEVSNPGPGQYILLNLRNGVDQKMDGNQSRTTNFDINVMRGTVPANASFQFSPGTARPVSVALPQGGG